MKLTDKEAQYLIKLARNSIECHLRGKKISASGFNSVKNKNFKELCGVFVTIKSFPSNELRGCIGIPYPEKPLKEAVAEAAANSATSDPRFPPLTFGELNHTIIELTILGKPEQIIVGSPTEYLSKIKIGQHGLIVELLDRKGLLLPQVPVEYGWDETEFICNTCMKAGLPMDAWFSPGVKIYKFTGHVFAELAPNGKVVEKKLSKSKK